MTSDLITRLSKLEGADRESDAEIDRAFGLHVDVYDLSGPWTRYPAPDHYRETSRYTASVDAAIALAEKALPGWGWLTQNCGSPTALMVKDDDIYEVQAANPAIALCIAILRAKEAGNVD